MKKLPEKFLDRLKSIVLQEHYADVVKTFSMIRPSTVRINTLKKSYAEIFSLVQHQGMSGQTMDFLPEALVLSGVVKKELTASDLVSSGMIYPQNFSSMLVARILNPSAADRVLDFCAAPGSKTSHLAALMDNQGELIALESVKERFYKLKAVLGILGVKNVQVKLMDARKFRTDVFFDKILVDVPCSSEGRFDVHDPKSLGYWSERKIKEMVNKQRGLLLAASRLLKTGGELVYSTCTFAPEENEGVLDWFFKKQGDYFDLQEIFLPQGVRQYPAVLNWQGKTFNPVIKKAVRILPDGLWDGFFMAKLIRKQ